MVTSQTAASQANSIQHLLKIHSCTHSQAKGAKTNAPLDAEAVMKHHLIETTRSEKAGQRACASKTPTNNRRQESGKWADSRSIIERPQIEK